MAVQAAVLRQSGSLEIEQSWALEPCTGVQWFLGSLCACTVGVLHVQTTVVVVSTVTYCRIRTCTPAKGGAREGAGSGWGLVWGVPPADICQAFLLVQLQPFIM
jgi:hypothetical protein